ncbi:hypothetical protein OHD45_27160 [Escherichia coli]|uniref:hypothetical protein n=1 Tax=Escherichia coli TaxID=562 RepID=UPI00223738AC|nr:hypothetical protein [Escherichia coli]MCW7368907.1 hypothetical protein [Escherichia coli]
MRITSANGPWVRAAFHDLGLRTLVMKACWRLNTVAYATAEPRTYSSGSGRFRRDFANGAQVVIDRSSPLASRNGAGCGGLVMLLPHGYEGQGPEHSSARLERYLQALC